MARPRKNMEDQQPCVVTFRMTEAEYLTFERLSKESGISKAQLARYAARGMKRVYFTEDMLAELKTLSRNCALIGNLLRLHATLLETVNLNAFYSENDKQEFARITALLEDAQDMNRIVYRKITDLKQALHKLNNENGNL